MVKIINSEKNEQLILHYVMLTRQLTSLADCFFHILRLKDSEIEKHGSLNLDYIGYRAYSQTEISDILIQCEKILKILDLDFNETLDLGRKRFIEKKEEFLKKYPKELWI